MRTLVLILTALLALSKADAAEVASPEELAPHWPR